MAENTIARHRSFTPKAQNKKIEPLTFELYGETFTAHPQIQGAVILEFISAGDDAAGPAGQILSFFGSALEEESLARFTALIHDPEKIVDMELLTEILGWLIEEYTSRPTTAS